jgi:hypothetical protein
LITGTAATDSIKQTGAMGAAGGDG